MVFRGIQHIGIETILKSLTYLIALTALASVFEYLGFIYKAVSLIALALTLHIDFKTKRYLNRTVINLLSVLIVVFSFYRLNLDDPATPLIEGLSLLLFVKFTEEKTFRDYMQIYAIALFMLAGSALFNIDLSFLVFFTVLLFMIAISMVILTFHSEDKTILLDKRSALKTITTAVMIPLISLPMMVLLFVVLPRTSYPLFSFLNRPDKGITGFTDNIRLGDVSEIQADNSAIFRAAMRPVDERQLYWRGITLSYFNGSSWSKPEDTPHDKVSLSMVTGETVVQELYLEAYDSNYLFALDRPTRVNLQGANLKGDLSVTLDKPISKRTRYEAVSKVSDRLPVLEIDYKAYLQLPDDIPERIRTLASSLADSEDELKIVEAVVKYLNSPPFRYTLHGLPITANPLEDFLFNHRAGNCEYYASAAAVLLRLRGIPSRLVVGYRGGYYNPIGSYYLVTQQSAHVWVEAFVRGSWLRIEPTPGSVLIGQTHKPLLLTVRLYLDTINYYWNQMVIGYSFERQVKGVIRLQGLLRDLQRPNIDSLKAFGLWLLIGLAVVLAVMVTLSYIKNKRGFEEALVQEFQKRLSRKGYHRQKNEGLREFVSKIKDEDLRQRAIDFVQVIERHYYGEKAVSNLDKRALRELLKRL